MTPAHRTLSTKPASWHGRYIALAMLAAALSACVTTGAGGGLHTPVSLGSASELAQTLNHVFQPQPSPDEGLRRATHVADGELDNESAAPAAATTEQPVALATQTASPGNSDTTKDDPWRCARTPGRMAASIATAKTSSSPNPTSTPLPAGYPPRPKPPALAASSVMANRTGAAAHQTRKLVATAMPRRWPSAWTNRSRRTHPSAHLSRRGRAG